MTKRKSVKVRDRDLTMRLLLESASGVVKELGFDKFTAVAVARDAGRHDSAVTRIFGSVEGLKHAYVKRNDYWNPMFEQYSLPEVFTEEMLKDHFTELMQENLQSFWDSKDMQEIIGRQITKRDKLMRSISDERELKAAKMLSFTHSYFAGTNTSFQTILGLLLYGTYGLVLHAKNNGSTVSGIDINNERERQTLHRTLTQVLEWAWENRNKADGKLNRKQAKLTMNYEFDALDSLAEQRAATLATGSNIDKAEPKIEIEVKRLKKLMKRHIISLENDTQIRTYLQINLHTLVNICNRLTVMGRVYNPDAELVIDLLDHIRQDMNEFIPQNLALPIMIVQSKVEELMLQWEKIAIGLRTAGISEELIAITGSPFRKFRVDANVKWWNYRYLLQFGRELDNILTKKELTNEQFDRCLLELGYNSIRFVSYFIEQLEDKLKPADASERLTILKRQRAMIKQNLPKIELRYNRYRAPLEKQLLDWIDAEQDSL